MSNIVVAEVHQLEGGVLLPQLYCLRANGEVNRAVTDTLLDLIAQSHPQEDELEGWVDRAQSGSYASPNTGRPDWGVNDINIWLVAPMAMSGHVCITNENTEYSSDDENGNPQQFTYEQFRAALKHWRQFRDLIAREGMENLVGRRYEAAFPD